MLRSSIRGLAYNISAFLLVLGGFTFMDKNGLTNIIGMLAIAIGLACTALNLYTYYLNKPFPIKAQWPLYAAAGSLVLLIFCYFLQSQFLVGVVLLLPLAFISACALQLDGRKTFFPK